MLNLQVPVFILETSECVVNEDRRAECSARDADPDPTPKIQIYILSDIKIWFAYTTSCVLRLKRIR
mgnify:CR=1 FL=1